MGALVGLILAITVALLALDGWIKKRRIRQLPEVSSEAFLEAYAGTVSLSGRESDVLMLRHQIATELGLPVSRLSPVQELAVLRDRYCRVVIGHLALDDLIEDLWVLRQDASLDVPQRSPSTVGEYIDLALQALRT